MPLPFLPPAGGWFQVLMQWLRTGTGVFILEGPSGCGKTRAVLEAASRVNIRILHEGSDTDEVLSTDKGYAYWWNRSRVKPLFGTPPVLFLDDAEATLDQLTSTKLRDLRGPGFRIIIAAHDMYALPALRPFIRGGGDWLKHFKARGPTKETLMTELPKYYAHAQRDLEARIVAANGDMRRLLIDLEPSSGSVEIAPPTNPFEIVTARLSGKPGVLPSEQFTKARRTSPLAMQDLAGAVAMADLWSDTDRHDFLGREWYVGTSLGHLTSEHATNKLTYNAFKTPTYETDSTTTKTAVQLAARTLDNRASDRAWPVYDTLETIYNMNNAGKGGLWDPKWFVEPKKRKKAPPKEFTVSYGRKRARQSGSLRQSKLGFKPLPK